MPAQNPLIRDALHALGAAVALGALSTFGDWLWTHYIQDGAIVPGVIHGAVIFLALAAVLAWAAGTRRAARLLVPSLPIAGMALAAVFYPLAHVVGYLGALLITWVGMWLVLAELQRRARDRAETGARGVVRGVLAAVGSGLAFWAISGIWTNPSPDGPSYPWHFASWTFAFLPGFLALLVGQPRNGEDLTFSL